MLDARSKGNSCISILMLQSEFLTRSFMRLRSRIQHTLWAINLPMGEQQFGLVGNAHSYAVIISVGKAILVVDMSSPM